MTVLPLVRNVTSGQVMADSHEHLIDLLKNLLQHEVRFIVCGGVAAVLHGVERPTVDLDMLKKIQEQQLCPLPPNKIVVRSY